ncbi:unnamed protein product, partial [Vitis vinifera]|uniref:Uncharacterized protein n=1 Tax=Vitis vinifera TaxID=29760 RepID=E0CUN9_VITVI
MTCTRTINDHNHIPITSCEGSNNHVSSSQAYTYALIGRGKVARDIQSSCTLGTTVVTGKFEAVSEPRKSTSMSDLQEILLMGLELSFLYFRCGKCKGGLSFCEPNFKDSSIICDEYWTDGRNWLSKLKDDVLIPMINFFSKAFGDCFLSFLFLFFFLIELSICFCFLVLLSMIIETLLIDNKNHNSYTLNISRSEFYVFSC